MVHVAILRYVFTKDVSDVSEALARLLQQVVAPRVDPAIIADTNSYRRQHCYTETTTAVLEARKVSLKRIFSAVAAASDSELSAGGRKLVGLPEWRAFTRAVGLIGRDVTDRGVPALPSSVGPPPLLSAPACLPLLSGASAPL